MLYYKIINGRTVYSRCRAIRAEEGWISKPSAEQIAAAGWQVFVPPVVPPQPQTEPYDGQIVEAVKRMLASSVEELTDEEALEVAALFATWASKIGQSVTAGEKPDRLWYDGKLYKVIQPHTVQEDWTPDITPALYVEVSIEEWPEIPENIPSTAPWMSGDKGTWKGQHYICQRDDCVWNPDQYPAAWKLV